MKYNYEYVKPQQILAHQTKQLLQSNANKSASPKGNGKGKWKRFAESSINVYAVCVCKCVCVHAQNTADWHSTCDPKCSKRCAQTKPNLTKPKPTQAQIFNSLILYF